ncbi:ABC transporter substrate-binding protein [Paracoccus sp. S-4012]|uniref:ABC transporter substrate-binding protein n=1 Tax=Paracoccus sp. S-4012 TaxID=2665648 RepID=UPI0012B0ABC5|nr:ABC transporter substrate-binding protein [Paracoccus sp. S-4012]MRX51388.1 ABC transporter substrate-binding protein [Paracoccus sp. S-4012]
MSGFRRISEAVLAGVLALVAPAAAEPPERVVSMNLCTDQLALMLAAPGQLVSVTAFAQDPRQSAMAAEAAALPANHARAEEVYALAPDLVLASDFTAPATLAMLRRLGIAVETFPAATSLDDVAAAIRKMGSALGREAEAEAMAARFETDVAALRADAAAAPRHPRALLYEANGYAQGSDTLAGEILAAAGFANAADEVGLAAGGMLSLEQLAMLAPEAVILPEPPPGTARGYELLAHPVVQALGAQAVPQSDRDWTCATPHVLRAAARLAEARRKLP